MSFDPNTIMLPEVVLTADKKKPFNETAFGGFITDFFGNMSNQQSSGAGSSSVTPQISLSNTPSADWNPDPLRPLAPLPPLPPKNSNTTAIVLTSLVVLGVTGLIAYSYSKKTTSKSKSLDGVGGKKNTKKIKPIKITL